MDRIEWFMMSSNRMLLNDLKFLQFVLMITFGMLAKLGVNVLWIYQFPSTYIICKIMSGFGVVKWFVLQKVKPPYFLLDKCDDITHSVDTAYILVPFHWTLQILIADRNRAISMCFGLKMQKFRANCSKFSFNPWNILLTDPDMQRISHMTLNKHKHKMIVYLLWHLLATYLGIDSSLPS